ncbi:hypothetical protein BKA62DRAFT_758948 [Auriculariales sp. MPI-PUGE-AT-0066]|nr:hypothetical protein BKA62DRAFT_758948 [Auriculariales sp. MPI-PUGE-AT-0066]
MPTKVPYLFEALPEELYALVLEHVESADVLPLAKRLAIAIDSGRLFEFSSLFRASIPRLKALHVEGTAPALQSLSIKTNTVGASDPHSRLFDGSAPRLRTACIDNMDLVPMKGTVFVAIQEADVVACTIASLVQIAGLAALVSLKIRLPHRPKDISAIDPAQLRMAWPSASLQCLSVTFHAFHLDYAYLCWRSLSRIIDLNISLDGPDDPLWTDIKPFELGPFLENMFSSLHLRIDVVPWKEETDTSMYGTSRILDSFSGRRFTTQVPILRRKPDSTDDGDLFEFWQPYCQMEYGLDNDGGLMWAEVPEPGTLRFPVLRRFVITASEQVTVDVEELLACARDLGLTAVRPTLELENVNISAAPPYEYFTFL